MTSPTTQIPLSAGSCDITDIDMNRKLLPYPKIIYLFIDLFIDFSLLFFADGTQQMSFLSALFISSQPQPSSSVIYSSLKNGEKKNSRHAPVTQFTHAS